jgi:hypothetical protein
VIEDRLDHLATQDARLPRSSNWYPGRFEVVQVENGVSTRLRQHEPVQFGLSLTPQHGMLLNGWVASRAATHNGGSGFYY